MIAEPLIGTHNRPIVHRLELAAINGDARFGEQVETPTQHNKPGAYLAKGPSIVLAEVGNRLVIGHEPAGRPHHLDIAPGFTF